MLGNNDHGGFRDREDDVGATSAEWEEVSVHLCGGLRVDIEGTTAEQAQFMGDAEQKIAEAFASAKEVAPSVLVLEDIHVYANVRSEADFEA